MLKKLALPALALAMLLGLASPPAKAAVQFGVTIGPPVYSSPYAYPDPYYDPYAVPGYYNYYAAPAPVYSVPYGYFGGSVGVRRDFDRHERFDNRGHQFQGNRGGHVAPHVDSRAGHRR